MRTQSTLIPLMISAVLCVVSATPSASQMRTDLTEFATAGPTPSFGTPGAVLDRLKAVLASNDVDGFAGLLGLKADKLRSSNEAMITYGLIREGAARQMILEDLGGRKFIAIGDRLWPLPFPLTEGKDGKWSFDTQRGLAEIVNRRVGENELATIDTMHEYVVAQYQYASDDRDGDGIYEFAKKLISSPGKLDGLYWDPSVYPEESPASALVETAAFGAAKRGEGYFGYRYRILTAQGDNVLGGKQSYLVNGYLTGGFALIAWPVSYRVTGVQTFIVNGMNVIYQRDLGPQTEQRAAAIMEFNPDADWTVVSE
ncbi:MULTISPECIES: DUF2950 family protein [Rhizobium]|uniref:DUF2950 family protein n=1 Tax=Rhizobium TaxID=379 RepID=UPI000BE7A0C3|nr:MULTISPECIES: DUF2950 family protein [Rhizobium]MBY4588606.1 DUF2950 domain-containing protein [Rhizobium redzepovicii]MBY4614804.1 DUF2950 domain-containing protein [Rhizobium redzepovicii]MDF0662651.1 DUF2950 family protein [Rhizobium sp. BC49]PDS82987.1 hypothetical protein CO654_23035 [Rhizobium sp. L18]TBY50831.1 DUF2950 domain-containing protein [Rhizobium leguminosarum bv. viciae]